MTSRLSLPSRTLGSAMVLWALIALSAHATRAAGATVSREVTIDPARVRVEVGPDGLRYRLPGSGSFFAEGDPDVPVISVHIALPEGVSAVSARLVPLATVEMPPARDLAPVPPPRPYEEGRAPSSRPLLAYDRWYPETPVVAVRDARIRGRRLAAVAVAPLRWLPDEGRVQLTTRFRIEVETAPVPAGDSRFRILRESPAGEHSFDGFLDRLEGAASGTGVLGTSEYRPLVNSGEPFAPTFRPTVDGSPVEMVIITDAAQAGAYQLLADFKTKTGLTTVVRTMDWIKSNYPQGVDAAETVRNFIQDAVSKWGTAFVLLGGDTDIVPIRYGHTQFFGTEEIPTDLYYTDLDGTWDADGDALFGEGYFGPFFPGDNVDLYPDVWVGRIPTTNATEAGIAVGRALTYQQNPPRGYQTDMLLLGEVLFPQTWTLSQEADYDGGVICEAVYDLGLPQFHFVKLYENHTAFPGALEETKSTVIDSINAGFGLVHHVGHGYINVMSVGKDGGTLNNGNVDAFTNGAEVGVLYAINCTSCAVDFNCVGERFLLNANGGMAVVIGSTRYDFPNTGEAYQFEFYDELWTDGITVLGETLAGSKATFIPFAKTDSAQRWTQFSQIFLGDPSTDMYTEVPESLAVTHAATLALGSGTFAVDVSKGGAPLDGATVCLFKDGDAYATGLTDASGHLDLPFTPDLTGTFSVGVRAHNAVPHLGTATVIAPPAPYLFAQSQLIDDDNAGPSTGNADAGIDAGETVELGFVLKNTGGAGESFICAILSTADPYVGITDNLALYPNIAASATASPTDRFLITAGDDAPDRREAKCTLDVFGALGSYSEEVILYIHAPAYEYYGQSVRDSIGNGDNNGILAANEDFAILPKVRNRGLGLATGVEVHLRSTDPAVTVTDSVSVLGNLAPGAIGYQPGDGLAARLSDVSVYHELRVVIMDSRGEVMSRLVDWVGPPVPAEPVAAGNASSIAISWTPVADPTLWGYNVYRSPTAGGIYTRINANTTRRIAYFKDEGLPGLTRYYYRISAVDSAGNESPASITASATTTLPLADNWPAEVFTATTGGVTLADLDGDGKPEVLGASDEIYAFHDNGDELTNGDNDVRTLGPITSTGGLNFWNTPAAADIDRDGVVEIAGVTWTNNLLVIVNADGSPEPGWPKNVDPAGYGTTNPIGSVCFADLDGDGFLEVFAIVADRIFAWRYDGTEVIDGDSNPATDGVLAVTGAKYSYATPTVANIDGDPYPEIICPMRDGKLYVFRHDGTPYPGFPFVSGGNMTASAAVGDIDGDGRPEIVFASSNNNLYARRADGTSATGFPKAMQFQSDVDSSPALGDLDGDGKPDIAVGASSGALFAIKGTTGGLLPGFPVQILDNLNNPVEVRSSPVIADVDGDGWRDIVVGDQIGRLHAFTHTGVLLPGFPIQTGNLIESAPAVWDIDGDGLTEVMVQGYDQHIYLWDTPWTFDPDLSTWPMFKRNQRNTGALTDDVFAITGVPDTRPGPRAVLLQNAPNPFREGSTRIVYRVPEGETYRHTRVQIFDLQGRLVRNLRDGEQPPGQYEARWDGRDDAGRLVASGIYPYRLQVAGETLTRKMVVIR